jgi:hypothetical protein
MYLSMCVCIHVRMYVNVCKIAQIQLMYHNIRECRIVAGVTKIS